MKKSDEKKKVGIKATLIKIHFAINFVIHSNATFAHIGEGRSVRILNWKFFLEFEGWFVKK
jgi:hypothetical protein